MCYVSICVCDGCVQNATVKRMEQLALCEEVTAKIGECNKKEIHSWKQRTLVVTSGEREVRR